jgi:hypothetical protein
MNVIGRTAPADAPALPVRADAGDADAGLALWLARAAMLAALAELVLLRTATRTAIHVPGIDRIAIGFRVVAEAGRLGYYLAVVLLAAGLAAMVVALHHRGHGPAAAGVGLVLGTAIASRAGLAGTEFVDAVVVIAVVGLAVGVARRLPRRARLPVILYAVAFVLGGGPERFGAVAMAGEVAAVGAMVCLAPVALRGADRLTRLVAAAVAVTTMVVLLASPTTPRILLLWNAGLTGALPAAAYAVGFGFVVAAVLRLWRAGRVWPAIALCLLVEAGIGFHSTYQSGLAILGLAVLTLYPVDAGPSALLTERRGGASSG